VVGGDDELRDLGRVAERDRRDQRAEVQRRRARGERVDDGPRVERAALVDAAEVEVVVGAEQGRDAVLLAGARERHPLGPRHALLALDHQAEIHGAPHSTTGVSIGCGGCILRLPKSFLEVGEMQSIVKRSAAGALVRRGAARGGSGRRSGTPRHACARPQRQHAAVRATARPDGLRQVAQLARRHQLRDAALVAREITTPQAVWFTKGTPREVERAVRATMRQAKRQHAVPTLVAYDLPYRDCGQYSAGGALDTRNTRSGSTASRRASATPAPT
jgi:hypothetical protein